MPEKVLISVPAEVVDIRPKVDRSWKLSFNTRELTGDEVAVLADNFQGEGWLVFKPNGSVTEEEIPTGDADSGIKTQSQRLRDVIFVDYRQHGKAGSFENYYRNYLEKLIEFAKSRLQEE